MPPKKDPRSIRQVREDQQLINYVWDTYRSPWIQARRPFVLEFLLNHAFYNGHQFVSLKGGVLTKIKRRPREVQIAHNQFKPACRVVLGQVTKNRPIQDVRALHSGFVNEADVQVGRKALRAVQHATNKAAVDEHLWLNLMKGGNACKRVFWDKLRGGFAEKHARNSDGELMFQDLKDDKERSQSEMEDISVAATKLIRDAGSDQPEQDIRSDRFTPIMTHGYLGDVSHDVLSVMEYAAQPNYIDLKEARMVLTERWHSLEYIRAAWPDLGMLVESEGDVALLFDTSGFSSLMPGAHIPRITGQAGHERGRMDGAIVRELVVKPTERNPLSVKFLENGKDLSDNELDPAEFGARMIWANKVILESPVGDDAKMPYVETPETKDVDVEFDVVNYVWMTEPGLFGSPMLTDAIPMQKAINRHRGMIIESINSWTHSKLLMPGNAMVNPGAFSNEAMEVINFNGTPPSYLEPPSVPGHFWRAIDSDVSMFNDTLMLHEVSRQGKVPAQVRTASALIRLQETDNLALAPIMYRYEASEAQVGQLSLNRVKQFYEDDRLMVMAGDRQKLEVEVFKRAAFATHNFAVYVHEGSSLPDSNAAKIQLVFEILQFAPWFFIDPKTQQPSREALARLINFGSLDEYAQDIDESRQAAERENTMMDDGVDIEPLPTDEDAIHLSSHYPIIHSPDFREKPQEIQDAFNRHAAIHEQRLLQKAQNAGASAQMMSDAAGRGAANVRDEQLAAQQGNGSQPEGGGLGAGGVDLETIIQTLASATGAR